MQKELKLKLSNLDSALAATNSSRIDGQQRLFTMLGKTVEKIDEVDEQKALYLDGLQTLSETRHEIQREAARSLETLLDKAEGAVRLYLQECEA